MHIKPAGPCCIDTSKEISRGRTGGWDTELPVAGD
jgi:hypothetical protein